MSGRSLSARGAPGASAAIDAALVAPLAAKYVWWKSAAEAAAEPERVVAQVMNLGDHADVEALAARVGDELLRNVLLHASAGQFNARSWAYWHYRLGLAEVDEVPPLPRRSLG